MPHFASWLVASLLAFSVSRVAATDGRNGFTYSYCASENTNSSASPYLWTWQSNGECHDHCNDQGTYAFAVVSYKQCWCSNIVPSQTLDMSDCSKTCPGFDIEWCGTDGESYLYVKLDGQPSGTASGSSSSASKTKSSQSSSTSTPQTSASPDDSLPPSSGQITTVTENGVTYTKVIYPSDSGAALHETNNGGSSTNTGAIVGGVVGGVGILAAVVAGVLFFLWRRRKQQREAAEGGQGGESGVQRYASTMSRSGLLRGEKTPQEPAPIATSFNRRQSRNLDQDSISPISASDRRNSSFRIDQRLNPSTIFAFDNSSAVSVGSLDDSRDYHRTLNVRNPDTQ